MDTQQPLFENKVANSGLLTIDLESFYPTDTFVSFDLKDYLFMELILKEKDFRAALKALDWTQYQGKHVCITCSADAIIPVWAYMLVAANLAPVAAAVYTNTVAGAITQYILAQINNIDTTSYTSERVVVKGCGEKEISPAIYAAITAKLQPIAKSIMYGEPCSTVPIYKAK